MKKIAQACVYAALGLLSVQSVVAGPTILQGSVSGTWSNAGSPYILVDNCTVQTGQLLVIDPGVEVTIADSKSLNVNGQIRAIGTEAQPITFAAGSGQYNAVYVFNGSSTPPTSEFTHCRFQNGLYGLYLHAYGRIDNAYTTLETTVTNCRFQVCDTGIYARAQAVDASQYMNPRRRSASVNPVIKKCRFDENNNAIAIATDGAGGTYYSTGTTVTIVENSYFRDQAGAAVVMIPGSHPSRGGTLKMTNNTVRNDASGRGVWVQDGNYNAVVKNNIFYGTLTAIERAGSNSGDIFYNCLYLNSTNFVNYPATYGDVVTTNANGTPCDLAQNIFLDPAFLSQEDAHLYQASPCIDAGTVQGAPTDDIDGGSRPQGPRFDIGIDEVPDPGAPKIRSISGSGLHCYGDTITLTVTVAGTAPFNYEWYLDGVVVTNDGRITGATTAKLVITNAGAGDVGSYTVRVWNALGEATSPPTGAAVDLSPICVDIKMFAGVIIAAEPGTTVRVEYSNDLSSGTWNTLDEFVLPKSPYTYIDYDSPNHSKRFYRAREIE